MEQYIGKQTTICKALCYHLRHNSTLNFEEDGYVLLSEIMNLSSFNFYGVSIPTILNYVDSDEKNRFTVKSLDVHYIRANEGHSVKGVRLDKIATKITEPCQCIYAVRTDKHSKIMKQGFLDKGKLNWFYFTDSYPSVFHKNGEPFSVIHDDKYNVLIYIDMQQAMDDGIVFWRSSNGVILTEGYEDIIDEEYFSHTELC